MSDISLSSDGENVPKTAPQKTTSENNVEDSVPEDAKDNISVSTDWETESDEKQSAPPVPEPSKQKQTSKQKSAARINEKSESSSESSSYINHKERHQKARERAFKKLDLGANDPNLTQHMDDRRTLSKKLEEDPVFRKKYIEEQERLRLEAEENESCADSAEMNNALKHISKLQGNDADEVSEQDHMDGISDDGSVHASYFESESQNSYTAKKSKKSKSRNGIYIKKLVVKNLVLNF